MRAAVPSTCTPCRTACLCEADRIPIARVMVYRSHIRSSRWRVLHLKMRGNQSRSEIRKPLVRRMLLGVLALWGTMPFQFKTGEAPGLSPAKGSNLEGRGNPSWSTAQVSETGDQPKHMDRHDVRLTRGCLHHSRHSAGRRHRCAFKHDCKPSDLRRKLVCHIADRFTVKPRFAQLDAAHPFSQFKKSKGETAASQ